jgi:hypothetical protein
MGNEIYICCPQVNYPMPAENRMKVLLVWLTVTKTKLNKDTHQADNFYKGYKN